MSVEREWLRSSGDVRPAHVGHKTNMHLNSVHRHNACEAPRGTGQHVVTETSDHPHCVQNQILTCARSPSTTAVSRLRTPGWTA